MHTNRDVARLLRELTELVTLAEGSAQSFRVRAYDKAAGAVRDLPQDVASMSTADLEAVDGIGRSSARKIREAVETGTIETLERLRKAFPPGLVELTRIPGLGPKTIVMLRDRLGVDSVEALRKAIADEQLRDLPGLGAKREEKIAKAIERLGLHGKDRRTPIIEVLPVARSLVAALGAVDGVSRVAYCGSLRRFRDTIGDIDIVVAAPAAVTDRLMDAVVALPDVRDVLARGDTKTSVVTGRGLQVDVRVVAPSQFGAAVLYFTGSKQHNIELRQRAIDRGWILNEYALADADTGDVVASRTEKAIYEALDLPLIAPELRAGTGEIAAAADGNLPHLVDVDDIKGDLHVHSTWSGDGRSSLADMVAAAAARGLDYIAITEHGEDLAINGLSRQEVEAEAAELDDLRRRHPGLTILHGAELNIAPDGSLDYDDEFLARFDWCVASVHSHFDLPVQEQTERVIAAMDHRAVNAIGHLTGRMIGRRPGIELDVDAVFDAAVRTGTALEINCHLDRLDVPAALLRRARDRADLRFVISTDAHHVNEFGNLRWGVHNARRGWVDRRRVVNTWPLDRFLAWAKGT